MNKNKVLVIGLDCFSPELTFDKWLAELPNINKLVKAGVWGHLQSTIPCITIPAWTSMVTGRDPGVLGFYGFRNRKDYSYNSLFFANSLSVNHPTIWNILSRNRKTSIVVGVPQTYPVKPLNGIMVGCFLGPDIDEQFVYPVEYRDELNKISEGYMIDVKQFRTDKKKWLLEQIYTMTDKRFKLVTDWITTKEWDFFMFVEMGPDRLHHGFWSACDPEHPNYSSDSEFKNAIKDYYKLIDKKIGELLDRIDSNTTVILVSDHGAKAMSGGFAINEWFIKEGLLTVKDYPDKPEKLTMDNIVWEKTCCWGEGGYYGRVFFNVENREPAGIVKEDKYTIFREELKERIENISTLSGSKMDTKVYKPEIIYTETNGVPPDLLIYFDDLNYRSVGSIGLNELFTEENDTGPDDANHDRYGVFVMADMQTINSGIAKSTRLKDLSIYDVAPTILNKFDISVDNYNMQGKVIKC